MQYQQILEKTNQQLGLWYNPYSLSISILTLLVALLAIFFAYIMWRQGKEYRQAFEDFLQEQKKTADSAVARNIIEMKTSIDEAITEAKSTAASLTGEALAAHKKQLAALEKVSKSVDSYRGGYTFTGLSGVNSFNVTGLPSTTYMDPISLGINKPMTYAVSSAPTSSLIFEPPSHDIEVIRKQVAELKALVEKIMTKEDKP
jgi:hypothetical protein